MAKDFNLMTYVCDDQISDTIQWLMMHQDCFDSFEYDSFRKKLLVKHANGVDEIKSGQYLNANYGILITSL